MTAVQELVADPVSFIRNNLLKIDGYCNDPPPQAFQPNGTILLTLQDVTNDYGGVQRPRNRKGVYALNNWIQGTTQYKATNLYLVRLATPNDVESFTAYICPYRTNASLSKHLGQDAALMFTAEMTGCSPYGATTIAGGQGERMPSKNELAGAKFQGNYVARLAERLAGVKLS